MGIDNDLARAAQHYRSGRLREAEPLCRRALEARPGDAEALDLLGRVLLRSGRAPFAVPLLEQSVRKRPGDLGSVLALGQALYEAGDTQAALTRFEGALRAQPEDGKARMGHGIALLDVNRVPEAVEDLRRAALLDPELPLRHFWLANALLADGNRELAMASFEQALALSAAYKDAHRIVGEQYTALGQLERARRMYVWGAALQPDDPQLRHLVAALDGGSGPVRASDDYVAGHFDRFADSFDEVLVERLEYRTPELIVDAARAALGASTRPIDVLDAGCGTGLCGPLLRPLAGRLVGVDLSSRMIERAKERGCYDELRVAEITASMAGDPASYDLIVAADVLVYFGAIDELFAAAASALRPGGIMAVSTERHDGPDEYVLQPSGRYAHALAYLHAVTTRVGLTEVETTECRLRTEHSKPVAGYISVARRPRAADEPA